MAQRTETGATVQGIAVCNTGWGMVGLMLLQVFPVGAGFSVSSKAGGPCKYRIRSYVCLVMSS